MRDGEQRQIKSQSGDAEKPEVQAETHRDCKRWERRHLKRQRERWWIGADRYWNKLPGGQRHQEINGESEIENGNWKRWGVGTKRQNREKVGRCRLG